MLWLRAEEWHASLQRTHRSFILSHKTTHIWWISYVKRAYTQMESCKEPPRHLQRCEWWRFFSFRWLTMPYLYSDTAQCVFVLFRAQSGYTTGSVFVSYFLNPLFKGSWLGMASLPLFRSACDMHTSSVTWVKTKVLWCCTVFNTGPGLHVCAMINFIFVSICDALTVWQRVSGGWWISKIVLSQFGNR